MRILTESLDNPCPLVLFIIRRMDCTNFNIRLETEAECAKAAEYDRISKFIDAPALSHPLVNERFKTSWALATEAKRMTFVRLHQSRLRAWSKAWETTCATYVRLMMVKLLTSKAWPSGVHHALLAAIATFDAEHANRINMYTS